MKTILRIFEQRVRGIRLIELVGFALALSMIFWVCLSKAREGDDIRHMNDLDQQIADQQQAVDALKIKVAGLERPSRLEALAKTYLGMTPVTPQHETDLDSLSEISKATPRAVLTQTQAVPAAAPATANAQDVITTGAQQATVKPAAAVQPVAAAPVKKAGAL